MTEKDKGEEAFKMLRTLVADRERRMKSIVLWYKKLEVALMEQNDIAIEEARTGFLAAQEAAIDAAIKAHKEAKKLENL